jgi:hypothetical protein
MGKISAQEYREYLNGMLRAYAKYSSDYMGIWREIRGMDDDAATAREKDLDDAKRQMEEQIDAAFKAARAQQALIEAQREASESWLELTKKGAKPEERARSAERLANALFRLEDARANVRGLDDNTVEWARSVRGALSELIQDYAAGGQFGVVAGLQELLAGIPAFAAGGYVPATPGGRIVRVAEAGQGEWMIPDSKMVTMGGSWGGGTTTVAAPEVNNDVRVYLGTREITDVVDTQIRKYEREAVGLLRAGR